MYCSTSPALVLCLLCSAGSLRALAPASATPREWKKQNASLRIGGEQVENGRPVLPLHAPLILNVTVNGPATLEVESVEVDVNLMDDWRNVEKQSPRTYLTGQRKTWRQQVVLKSSKPGDLIIKGVSVRYRETKEADWVKSQWQDITVVVITSIAHADAKEIKPVPDIERLPEKPHWSRFLPWVGGVLLGLGLAGSGLYLWRRWQKKTKVVPPHEWALRVLAQLETQPAPENAPADWYHISLSHIVRSYIERRFQLPASHQTTAEFTTSVRESSLVEEQQLQLLTRFVEMCDLAKYTGVAATLSDCEQVLEVARAFVCQTTSPD